MRRRVKIEMTFDVEASVSRRELRAFLIDAVETWGGQRPPEDHLFGGVEHTEVHFLEGWPIKREKISSE